MDFDFITLQECAKPYLSFCEMTFAILNNHKIQRKNDLYEYRSHGCLVIALSRIRKRQQPLPRSRLMMILDCLTVRQKEKRKMACKPGSVRFLKTLTAIHLGCMSPYTSSNLPGFSADHAIESLFGLAPSGVYPAMRCYQRCGALLPHPFTLTDHSEE